MTTSKRSLIDWIAPLFFLVYLMLFPLSVGAVDYYIDPLGGVSQTSGQSAATPFKNVSSILTWTGVDNIYIAKGRVLRDTFTPTVGDVKISSYSGTTTDGAPFELLDWYQATDASNATNLLGTNVGLRGIAKHPNPTGGTSTYFMVEECATCGMGSGWGVKLRMSNDGITWTTGTTIDALSDVSLASSNSGGYADPYISWDSVNSRWEIVAEGVPSGGPSATADFYHLTAPSAGTPYTLTPGGVASGLTFFGLEQSGCTFNHEPILVPNFNGYRWLYFMGDEANYDGAEIYGARASIGAVSGFSTSGVSKVLKIEDFEPFVTHASANGFIRPGGPFIYEVNGTDRLFLPIHAYQVGVAPERGGSNTYNISRLFLTSTADGYTFVNHGMLQGIGPVGSGVSNGPQFTQGINEGNGRVNLYMTAFSGSIYNLYLRPMVATDPDYAVISGATVRTNWTQYTGEAQNTHKTAAVANMNAANGRRYLAQPFHVSVNATAEGMAMKLNRHTLWDAPPVAKTISYAIYTGDSYPGQDGGALVAETATLDYTTGVSQGSGSANRAILQFSSPVNLTAGVTYWAVLPGPTATYDGQTASGCTSLYFYANNPGEYNDGGLLVDNDFAGIWSNAYHVQSLDFILYTADRTWYTYPLTVEPKIVSFSGVSKVSGTTSENLSSNIPWYWTGNTLYVFSDGHPVTYYPKGIEANNLYHCIDGNTQTGVTVSQLRLTGSVESAVKLDGGGSQLDYSVMTRCATGFQVSDTGVSVINVTSYGNNDGAQFDAAGGLMNSIIWNSLYRDLRGTTSGQSGYNTVQEAGDATPDFVNPGKGIFYLRTPLDGTTDRDTDGTTDTGYTDIEGNDITRGTPDRGAYEFRLYFDGLIGE